MVFIPCADHGDHRAEGSPPGRCACRACTLSTTVGAHKTPAGALPPAATAAPLADGVGDQRLHVVDGLEVNHGAERDVALARIAHGSDLPCPRNLATKASATLSSTMIRSVDMQIWPWFMNAPKAAAFTASSRSASSSTSNGALPPSSRRHGLQVFGRALGDDLAHRGGAGEVHAPHGRMGDQGPHHLPARRPRHG